MMNRVSIGFCTVSLALTAVVLVAGFNLAAMPRQSIAAAKTPVPAALRWKNFPLWVTSNDRNYSSRNA